MEKSISNKLVWLAILVLSAAVLVLAFSLYQQSQRIDILVSTTSSKPSESSSITTNDEKQARRIATVEDLDRIRSLVDKGAYEEALEEHIWFHEVSRYSPSLAGVRASFALSNWADLGKRFPPAMEALIDLKDQYKEAALSGSGSFDEIGDLFAILRTLEEEEKIVEYFKILTEKDPKNAKIVYRLVEEFLVKNREFELVSQFIGDPMLKYEEIRYRRESLLSYANSLTDSEKQRSLRNGNDMFVNDVTSLITVLSQLNRKEEARAVQKRAIEYYPNDSVLSALAD